MSQTTFEYETPNGFPEPSHVKRILTQIAVLLGFLSLVIIPLSIYGCRTERARWTAAEAMNLYAEGQPDAALQKLRLALESSGNDSAIAILLADTLVRQGRPEEALSLCTQILETDPNMLMAIQIKSDCEQAMDRPDEALHTLKSMYPYLTQEEAQHSTRRNNLAYYRALANDEIQIAHDDIRSVLRDHALSNYWSTEVGLSLETQAIISIAQLSRKLGQRDDGNKLLDQKIEEYEQLVFLFENELMRVVYDRIADEFPPKPKWERETSSLRSEIEQTRGELAFLLVARALLAQENDDLLRCNTDRTHAQRLGFSSDQLAEQLPADAVCLDTLRLASTLLDTYGYVLFRMDEFGEALRNLDLAIMATEYQLLSLDSPLRNSSTESPEFDDSLAEAELKKTLAAIYYHRMLVHRALGSLSASKNSTSASEIELEKADAERIKSLGFDPTSRLY